MWSPCVASRETCCQHQGHAPRAKRSSDDILSAQNVTAVQLCAVRDELPVGTATYNVEGVAGSGRGGVGRVDLIDGSWT